MTTEHTPTPWRLGTERNPGEWRLLADQGPITVCPALAGLADAKFILRAVNPYETMLEALKEAARLYETYGLLAKSDDCGKWINAVRDAIALAEKGT